MSSFFRAFPAPPDWKVDWDELNRRYSWLASLRGCPQDPTFHQEGDAWIHTRMVCEQLARLDEWRCLVDCDRTVLFAAALLHDIGKPSCTREESDGRISSRGHSRRGSVMARVLLWRMGVEFSMREQVCGLIRHHQLPYFVTERADSQRLLITASQTVSCRHLEILAQADALGRESSDKSELLDNVALFAEMCRELKCLEGPWRFESDHSRFMYFQVRGRDPGYRAYDDCACDVIVMSGLPGSGKDHWIKKNACGLQVISLDEIRRRQRWQPSQPQDHIVREARGMAQACLRERRPFVWNATSISRHLRSLSTRLFASYRARVRVVYLEVAESVLLQRNRSRAHPVPEAVIERMLNQWEVPDLTEAHSVELVTEVGDNSRGRE